jgi:hypothetical protein
MAFIKYSDVELLGVIENICEECGAKMELIDDKLVCECGNETWVMEEKND